MILKNTLYKFILFMTITFMIVSHNKLNSQVFDNVKFNEMFTKSQKLIQKQDWVDAEEGFVEIINQFESGAESVYGAKFGTMYYFKGICELMQKKYEQASESFKTCADKFPNKTDTPLSKQNQFTDLAILQEATARMYNNEAQKSVELFEKFKNIVKNKPEIKFNKGAYYSSFALALLKAKNIEKSHKLFDLIFANPKKLGLNSSSIFQCFSSYMNTVINDKTPEHGINFIKKYKNKIRFSSLDSYRKKFGSNLIQLAQKSSSLGEKNKDDSKLFEDSISLSLLILSFISSEKELLNKYKGYPEVNFKVNKKFQEMIKKIEMDTSKENSVDEIRLLLRLKNFDLLKNKYAHLAISEYMVNNYQTSKNYPIYLLNATSSAAKTNNFILAEKYGDTFLKKFPNHEYKDTVSEMMLGSLFKKKKYDKCIEIAEKIRSKYKPGEAQRELADFVASGSYYYKNRNELAKEEFIKFIKNYPESNKLETVLYFEVDNLMKMNDFDSAKTKITSFLDKYPNSNHKPSILFKKALCEMQDSEFASVIKTCEEIETNYPNLPIISGTLGLRGKALKSLKKYKEAKEVFKKAYDSSKLFSQRKSEGKFILQLISVSSELNDDTAVVEYYDKYFPNYEGEAYDTQIIVNSLKALEKVNRVDDGLAQLKKTVFDLSKSKNPKLESTLNTYVKKISESKNISEVIDELDKMSKNTVLSKRLQALVVGSSIDLLKREIKTSKDNNNKISYNAKLNVSSNRLLNDFTNDDLSNYNLVQKASILSDRGDSNKSNEVFAYLENRGGKYIDHAIFQRAKDLIYSSDSSQAKQAVEMFDKIINVYKSNKSHLALFHQAKYYTLRKDWKNAEKKWDDFRKTKQGTTLEKAEAGYRQAYVFEMSGNIDRAINGYIGMASNYQGVIAYAPDAYLRVADLFIDNKKDRSKAYQVIKPVADAYERSVRTGNIKLEDDKEGKIKKIIALRKELSKEFAK